MTDKAADLTQTAPEPVEFMQTEPDVNSEPEAAKIETAPAAKRGSGLLGGVVGGLIAAAFGFGLAQYVPNGWPLQDTSGLQASLDSQQQAVAALKAKLDQPSPAPDLSGLTDQIQALDERIAALESKPADNISDSAIKALQSQIDTLKAAPMAAVDTSAIEAMMKEAEASAAKIKEDAAAISAKASAKLALAQLQAALDSGAPFAAVLPALGDVPEVLAQSADSGLPSLSQLSDAFPDAARAAIDAGLRSNMGESWTDRATNFLRTQTGARSLDPRDGTDADAILSRAEAALKSADLKTALVEVASLPEAAAAPMADWRALAEKRQAGVEAVAGLAAALGE